MRSFFTPGSPAADQIKVFDDTADLPELWRTFNVHYVAAANFSGLFSLFDQLYGPSFVQKNLLSEFVRQNDLQKRILLLREQPHVNFMQTPKKALFQSPLTRRVLDLDSKIKKRKQKLYLVHRFQRNGEQRRTIHQPPLNQNFLSSTTQETNGEESCQRSLP